MPQQRRNIIIHVARAKTRNGGTGKMKENSVRTHGNGCSRRDFWFPIKNSPEPGADHELWRFNTAENKGAACTFTLPVIA